MLTIYSDKHRLHHGTELKDGILKPSVEMPSRADWFASRLGTRQLSRVVDLV